MCTYVYVYIHVCITIYSQFILLLTCLSVHSFIHTFIHWNRSVGTQRGAERMIWCLACYSVGLGFRICSVGVHGFLAMKISYSMACKWSRVPDTRKDLDIKLNTKSSKPSTKYLPAGRKGFVSSKGQANAKPWHRSIKWGYDIDP